MSNLLLDHARSFVTKAQDKLIGFDEHYSIYGPEPMEGPKSYVTGGVRQAVVQEIWSDYLILDIKDGKTIGRTEIAF